VLDSDLRLNLSEVVEHRDVDGVNFSSGPSHLREVLLGLINSRALHHSGSDKFLPGVLTEVRADRVQGDEHLLHVHHEDVGVGLLGLTNQVGLLDRHELIETVLDNISVVEATVARVTKVKALVDFAQEDFIPVIEFGGVS
jgi:hypothetical protein